MFDKSNETPPIMALIYKDKESAKKIFKEWKYVSKGNIFNDIEISVIEKKNIGHCDGYFIHITSNMEECAKRSEDRGYPIDKTLFMVISRYQYMDIDMYYNNLGIFKKQLESNNEYYIAPAVFKSGEVNGDINDIEIGTDLAIKMNKIKFINYDDIAPNDIEYAVVERPNK